MHSQNIAQKIRSNLNINSDTSLPDSGSLTAAGSDDIPYILNIAGSSQNIPPETRTGLISPTHNYDNRESEKPTTS